MTELVLGTAQFGHGYGVTNQSKRIDDASVADILQAAVAGGIRSFDTAEGYGDAQERVGQMMPSQASPQYISKFALEGRPSPDLLYRRAASRLRASGIHALLFHRVQDLLDDRLPETLRLIRDAKAKGEISQFGVSVYDEDDLELAIRVVPDLGILQIPGSVVDRRLLDSSVLHSVRERGVQVHVRSAFLQGLLLAPQAKVPSQFTRLLPILDALDSVSARHATSRLALLLGFLASHENADAIVVGSTSVDELTQILEAWDEVDGSATALRVDDVPLEIIDPRKW